MKNALMRLLGFFAGCGTVLFLTYYLDEIRMVAFLLETESRIVKSVRATGSIPESLAVLPGVGGRLSDFVACGALSYTVHADQTITIVRRKGRVGDVAFEMSRKFSVAPYLKTGF